ncbi:MAG TPA: dihydrolipoamide acetyltransferase family protein [Ktedonobacteraceae bacterium]|nr:dihydrolipoamide acetyltransferase family protein [Ktedonobacteraceae bacterium]
MATNVILPALGMSQDTGKIVQWLKAEGERVAKGEPLAEIETDKATVEIEALADGVLAHVVASAGDDVPVGQVIAVILTPEEVSREEESMPFSLPASPLASRIAAEHNLDLRLVTSAGRRIQKSDVLAYLQDQEQAATILVPARLTMASPKARRLANEQGKELATIQGSGPRGAVLAADVIASTVQLSAVPVAAAVNGATTEPDTANAGATHEVSLSNTWRIMAERTTQSWTDVPHFYLVREVNASRLIAWRAQLLKRVTEKVTYTDLLVKIVAAALHIHPRLNTSWSEGKILIKEAIHIGLAVAVEEGLVVPVIHQADTLSLGEIARRRIDVVARAQSGRLRPQDINDGTFTISNLGMYNVDAFNAIINQPQAAILAVGRIAERVVPVNGQPAVQPVMVLTLSCDHRAVDGARGAQFLDTVATLIEEPLGLVV